METGIFDEPMSEVEGQVACAASRDHVVDNPGLHNILGYLIQNTRGRAYTSTAEYAIEESKASESNDDWIQLEQVCASQISHLLEVLVRMGQFQESHEDIFLGELRKADELEDGAKSLSWRYHEFDCWRVVQTSSTEMLVMRKGSARWEADHGLRDCAVWNIQHQHAEILFTVMKELLARAATSPPSEVVQARRQKLVDMAAASSSSPDGSDSSVSCCDPGDSKQKQRRERRHKQKTKKNKQKTKKKHKTSTSYALERLFKHMTLTPDLLQKHEALHKSLSETRPGGWRIPVAEVDEDASRKSVASATSASAWSGYSDTSEVGKERANSTLVKLHNDLKLHTEPLGASEWTSHALLLDGPNLRTTKMLCAAGWSAYHLHVPNFNVRDCSSIYAQHEQCPIHLYRMSTAQFLNDAQLHAWASKYHSPFSFIFLDYTDATHWQADIQSLFHQELVHNKYVLGLTVPAVTDGIGYKKDRHRRGESRNRIKIGPLLVSFDFDFSFLFKMMFEVPPGTRFHEAFVYKAKGKRTWMGFAAFSGQVCFTAREWNAKLPWDHASTPQQREGLQMHDEMYCYLCLRHDFAVGRRHHDVSLEELQKLSKSEYPLLCQALSTFEAAIAPFKLASLTQLLAEERNKATQLEGRNALLQAQLSNTSRELEVLKAKEVDRLQRQLRDTARELEALKAREVDRCEHAWRKQSWTESQWRSWSKWEGWQDWSTGHVEG